MRSLLLLLPLALAAQTYDIVMSGGRVMDPESDRMVQRRALKERDLAMNFPARIVG
jgi:hypothetical protein